METAAAKLSAIVARQDVPQDARETISSIVNTPLQTDVWIYRLVVLVLGATALTTVMAAIILVATKNGELPEAVLAIGSTAVGALAGLLAPAPGR
jgi:hypothetical protein